MSDRLDEFIEKMNVLPFPGAPLRRVFSDKRGKDAHCRLFYPDFTADFSFTLEGAAAGLRNYLTVRLLQPERAGRLSPLSVSLAAALLAIAPDCYVSCDYPFVASKEQLEEAIGELAGIFNSSFHGISRLMADRAARAELFAKEAAEVNEAFGEEIYRAENGFFIGDDEEEDLARFTKMFLRMKTARRFMPPYSYLYADQPERALRGIGSYASKDHELEALKNLPAENIRVSSLQKELFLSYKRSDGISFAPRVLLGALLTILVGALLGAAVLIPLYLLAAGAFSPQVVYSSAAFSPGMIVAAAITLSGMVYFLFDQRIFLAVIYGRKLSSSYAEMITAGEKRFMRTAASIFLALLISFTLFSGNRTVRYEKERVADSSGFFSFAETYHSYEDVEKAGILPDRSGALFTLFLRMKDGQTVKTAGIEEKALRERILPLLEKNGISPVTLKSADELD